jgi:hypothetical protein
MRRTIASAALAVGVLIGAAGAAVFTPIGLVGAQQGAEETSAHQPGAWITEVLEPLVSNGTINQAQADAVVEALVDARPERRHGGPGHHLPWDAIADLLGMTTDELRAALSEGNTLAEIAAQQGVDVADLVDVIMTNMAERLAEAVDDGALTQERADAILANAEERITAFLNGERPERSRDGRPFRERRIERRAAAEAAA